MLKLGREKSEINVVADQIGTPTYALDLAKAIFKILTCHQWVPGIFHFTDEGVASWYDFTVAIHRIAGIKACRVNPIPTRDYPTRPLARPTACLINQKSKPRMASKFLTGKFRLMIV